MRESREKLANDRAAMVVVAFNIAVIALTAAVLLAALLVPTENSTSALVIAIAAGVLGTAAFTLTQLIVTRRAASAAVAEAVRNAVAEHFRDFLPAADFAAGDAADPRLNAELQSDLRQSDLFQYRGVHTVQSAVRLANAGSLGLVATFVLPDPASMTSAMRMRIPSRARTSRIPSATAEQLIEKALADLKVGFAGLFLERHHCSQIIVHFVNPLPPDRIELFSNSVWVAMHTGMYVHRYPRTVRFASTSHAYRLLSNELAATIQGATKSVRLAPTMTHLQFEELYREVFGEAYALVLEDQYSTQKRKFQRVLPRRTT